MATILNRLAISLTSRRLILPSGAETLVHPNQIIAWVCLAPPGLPHPHPIAWRFPAILDTGCAFPFVMHETHWNDWVGPIRQFMGELPDGRVFGKPARRRRASVWVYSNRPGEFAEVVADRAPIRLEVEDKIGVIISNVMEDVGGVRNRDRDYH